MEVNVFEVVVEVVLVLEVVLVVELDLGVGEPKVTTTLIYIRTI